VAISSDLNIVEKYMKELNDVNTSDIMSPKLSQSKSYLKILGILYFIEDTNLSNIIKRIIKTFYIFDGIILAFQPCIIKASLKLNIAVVWVDIWNFQNSTKAKLLINRCLNIE